jgi:hypothetical protein
MECFGLFADLLDKAVFLGHADSRNHFRRVSTGCNGWQALFLI